MWKANRRNYRLLLGEKTIRPHTERDWMFLAMILVDAVITVGVPIAILAWILKSHSFMRTRVTKRGPRRQEAITIPYVSMSDRCAIAPVKKEAVLATIGSRRNQILAPGIRKMSSKTAAKLSRCSSERGCAA
jgi:hypothetical protein